MRTLAQTFYIAVAMLMCMAAGAVAHEYSNGAVTIEHPWAATTPPGAKVGAAYMTVKNSGDVPLRLVAAATPAAERVELHMMSMEGGIMRMRPMTDGVVIPPGGAFRFTPGGAHLMLIGLKKPLAEEDLVDLRLMFEGGLAMDVELYVETTASHGH